ncbi:MAG: hypothetical protein WBA46_11020 [Thermomicrobiales bacterium]
MTDDTKPTPPPADDASEPSSSVVEAAEPTQPAPTDSGPPRGRRTSTEGNRSRSLYAVLGIGVASLLVLLGIIYFSATKRENPEQPICTAVATDAAEQAILAGEVHRIVVNYDNQIDAPTDPQWGPVLARVDYVDGSCGNLPQGLVAKEEMARILGTAYLYNQITTQTQVEIILRGTDSLNPALLQLPTATPTATPRVTPTPATPVVIVVTATAEPTATPTETPTASPSPTTTREDATVSSGSPAPTGTPRASGTPSPTPRDTVTPEPTETPRS